MYTEKSIVTRIKLCGSGNNPDVNYLKMNKPIAVHSYNGKLLGNSKDESQKHHAK